MSIPQAGPEPVRRRSAGMTGVLIAFAAGTAVSVGLGLYGRSSPQNGYAVNIAGFSSPIAVKAWLATVAAALGVVQLYSSLTIYGKLPRFGSGAVIGFLHRWSGRAAVVVSVPVAVQCLYALGFQDFNTRGLIHSFLGCFFYGAFVAKMLLLQRKDTPRWALPVAGGLAFASLAGIWLTAGLWYFQHYGLTT